MPELRERDEYDELMQKLLDSLSPEERLRSLSPEERLRDLSAEEVLGHYKPEEALLALPVAILRGLSDDYIRSLPAEVQRIIRERLSRSR